MMLSSKLCNKSRWKYLEKKAETLESLVSYSSFDVNPNCFQCTTKGEQKWYHFHNNYYVLDPTLQDSLSYKYSVIRGPLYRHIFVPGMYCKVCISSNINNISLYVRSNVLKITHFQLGLWLYLIWADNKLHVDTRKNKYTFVSLDGAPVLCKTFLNILVSA